MKIHEPPAFVGPRISGRAESVAALEKSGTAREAPDKLVIDGDCIRFKFNSRDGSSAAQRGESPDTTLRSDGIDSSGR